MLRRYCVGVVNTQNLLALRKWDYLSNVGGPHSGCWRTWEQKLFPREEEILLLECRISPQLSFQFAGLSALWIWGFLVPIITWANPWNKFLHIHMKKYIYKCMYFYICIYICILYIHIICTYVYIIIKLYIFKFIYLYIIYKTYI